MVVGDGRVCGGMGGPVRCAVDTVGVDVHVVGVAGAPLRVGVGEVVVVCAVVL